MVRVQYNDVLWVSELIILFFVQGLKYLNVISTTCYNYNNAAPHLLEWTLLLATAAMRVPMMLPATV